MKIEASEKADGEYLSCEEPQEAERFRYENKFFNMQNIYLQV